jgi:hypothetical protein
MTVSGVGARGQYGPARRGSASPVLRSVRSIQRKRNDVRTELGSRRWSVEYLEESLEIGTGVRRHPEPQTIGRAHLQNSDDGFVVGIDQTRDARRKRECHVASVPARCAKCVAQNRTGCLTILRLPWYYRATMFARLLVVVLSVILTDPPDRRAAFA